MNRGVAGRVLMPKTACKKSRVSVPLNSIVFMYRALHSDFWLIWLCSLVIQTIINACLQQYWLEYSAYSYYNLCVRWVDDILVQPSASDFYPGDDDIICGFTFLPCPLDSLEVLQLASGLRPARYRGLGFWLPASWVWCSWLQRSHSGGYKGTTPVRVLF